MASGQANTWMTKAMAATPPALSATARLRLRRSGQAEYPCDKAPEEMRPRLQPHLPEVRDRPARPVRSGQAEYPV